MALGIGAVVARNEQDLPVAVMVYRHKQEPGFAPQLEGVCGLTPQEARELLRELFAIVSEGQLGDEGIPFVEVDDSIHTISQEGQMVWTCRACGEMGINPEDIRHKEV